jgi:XTP/dITP diphosphohydrolase
VCGGGGGGGRAGGGGPRYRCVAVLAFPSGEEIHAEGTCEGTLEPKPRGTGGFGYDPIFVPAGEDRTMAELADAEKDRISHRGRALRALRAALEAS